jgi:hypothetical protein
MSDRTAESVGGLRHLDHLTLVSDRSLWSPTGPRDAYGLGRGASQASVKNG